MIRKYLNLLPAIALLFYVKQACAIGITIDTGFVQSFAAAVSGNVNQQDVQLPTGNDFFSLNTAAADTGSLPQTSASSTAIWRFNNATTSAIWSGEQDFFNQGAGFFASSARAQSVLQFTLTEAVDYTLSGSLGLNTLNVGATGDYFGSLVNLGGSPAPIPSTWQESELLTAVSTPVLLTQLAWSGNETGSLTGQLLPGSYSFTVFGDIRNGLGGDGHGGFTFTMTSAEVTPPDNGGGNGGSSVPDAGSTVVMLGMALGVLGVVDRIRSKLGSVRSALSLVKIPLILTAIAMLVSVRQASAIIVLDFEGLRDQERINDFYNGGTGSLGSSGPNYGVSFTPDSLALKSASSGGNGNFSNNPSGDSIAFFLTGAGDTMNIAGGFDTGFSFFYAAAFAGNVNVYDGFNGTGNLLTSLALPVTANPYTVWTPIGVTFNGTAESVVFGGSANFIGFDDITLGSSTPGGNGGSSVPDTGSTMVMLGMGLTAIGGIRHKLNV